MITIDLLRGHGRPRKSRPLRIILTILPFILPVGLVLVMSSNYIRNLNVIDIQQKNLNHLEKKIANLSDSSRFREAIKSQIVENKLRMVEMADILPCYVQWTQALMSISQNLPEAFILKELNVNVSSVSIEVPKRQKPEHQIKINIPRRTLRISIYSKTDPNNDRLVQGFIRDLRSDNSIAWMIKDLRLSSHKLEEIHQQEVTRYEIDCVLKTPFLEKHHVL